MNTYKFFTTNSPFTKGPEKEKRDQRQKSETKIIASLIRT